MELVGFVAQMFKILGGEHKTSENSCSKSWYYIDACEKGSPLSGENDDCRGRYDLWSRPSLQLSLAYKSAPKRSSLAFRKLRKS